MCAVSLGALKSTLTLLWLVLLAPTCNSVRLDNEKASFFEDTASATAQRVTQSASSESDVEVIVEVKSAEKVPDLDGEDAAWANGKPDVYCGVEIKNDRWETQTQFKTTLPVWAEKHTFSNYDCTSPITFKLYDRDEAGPDLLGVATLDADAFKHQPYEKPALTVKNPKDLIEVKGSKLAVSARLSIPGACGHATVKKGDKVKLTEEEGGRVGEVIDIDRSHGDEAGDYEVKVKFHDDKDPKEEWYEEGDVQVIDSNVPATPATTVTVGTQTKPTIGSNPSAKPDSSDDVDEAESEIKEIPVVEEKKCKDWSEEMLPKAWEKVPSRRRPGKMVFHNEDRRIRVASVKRACEYETGVIPWH